MALHWNTVYFWWFKCSVSVCVGGSSGPGLFGDDPQSYSAHSCCFPLWAQSWTVRETSLNQRRNEEQGGSSAVNVMVFFAGGLCLTGLISSLLYLSKASQVWQQLYLSSSTTSIFHRRITISLLFCDTVAAIFTGLALLEEYKEDGWMLKVMGGFVTWEALIYVLQDLNQRAKKHGNAAFTKLFWKI